MANDYFDSDDCTERPRPTPTAAAGALCPLLRLIVE